jgi:2-polyprenyl-3-methyl-5-hydroxy-6-metoxy-1,4-benzoquinol methylase
LLMSTAVAPFLRLHSLARRNRQPEVMDQPGIDSGQHSHALAALGRINWLSRSSAIVWPPLKRLAALHPGRTVRVLDIASGGGDVTIALARKARRTGRRLEFVGCDASEVAIDFARQRATSCSEPVKFECLNVLDSPLPSGFDAVVCSLFLHHLTDEQAEMLLRRMADAARYLVVVNDLVRSRLGYLLAVAGTQLLTRSRVVHVDGPLSVQGAFTRAEALELANRAGLRGATVSRHWPQRFRLQWWKP